MEKTRRLPGLLLLTLAAVAAVHFRRQARAAQAALVVLVAAEMGQELVLVPMAPQIAEAVVVVGQKTSSHTTAVLELSLLPSAKADL